MQTHLAVAEPQIRQCTQPPTVVVAVISVDVVVASAIAVNHNSFLYREIKDKIL